MQCQTLKKKSILRKRAVIELQSITVHYEGLVTFPNRLH